MKRYSEAPVISGIVIATVAVFMLLMVLCGCIRTVYVPVESSALRTDTLRLSTLRVDTVLNSDTVRLMQRGDTVYNEVIKWRWRVSQTHDTVYQSKVDSVYVEKPYPVEVVKEVPREMSWWETVLVWMGFGLVVFSAWKVYKLYKS